MDTTETQTEIIKVTELLLNRVENIKWYYFEINIDKYDVVARTAAPPPDSPENIMRKILAQIHGTKEGWYRYEKNGSSLPEHDGVATLHSEHLLALLEYLRLYPEIMSEVMTRIFDIGNILQDPGTVTSATTSAVSGMLKPFNRKEHKARGKKFDQRFRDNPGFRNNPDNVVALAEGDSWFCFPKIHLPGLRGLFNDAVHDIIDHLIDRPEYAVHSLAAGGDWLNNMLDEKNQQYVENLSKLMPDVFLVSGGGNDMAVDNRIAHMVRTLPLEGRRDLVSDKDPVSAKIRNSLLPLRFSANRTRPIDEEMYRRGLELISDDFIRFINICMVQYFALFYRLLIKTNKFKGMMIITHGYDFAIPSKERSGWFWTWKRILNSELGLNSGKWLFDPLCTRGISDPADQRAVLYVMIYEFNEMLCQLARFSWFPNVFHIDARGVANNGNDWFDELHLKSNVFEKVAHSYDECIKLYKPQFRNYAQTGVMPELQPTDKVITVKKTL